MLKDSLSGSGALKILGIQTKHLDKEQCIVMFLGCTAQTQPLNVKLMIFSSFLKY